MDIFSVTDLVTMSITNNTERFFTIDSRLVPPGGPYTLAQLFIDFCSFKALYAADATMQSWFNGDSPYLTTTPITDPGNGTVCSSGGSGGSGGADTTYVDAGDATAVSTAESYTDSVAATLQSRYKGVALDLLQIYTGNLRSGIVFSFRVNPSDGDVFVIKSNSATKSFVFKNSPTGSQVQRGGDRSASMDNLIAAILYDGAYYAYTSGQNTSYEYNYGGLLGDSPIKSVILLSNSSNTDRIYGTFASPTSMKYINFNGASDYSITDISDIPSSDPGVQTFGPYSTSLAIGDIFGVRNGVNLYQKVDNGGAKQVGLNGIQNINHPEDSGIIAIQDVDGVKLFLDPSFPQLKKLPVADLTATFYMNDINTSVDLVAGQSCILGTSNTWILTDANTQSTYSGFMGISLTDTLTGLAPNVALPGSFVRNDAWSWVSNDMSKKNLYLSETPGQFTQIPPSTSAAADLIVAQIITPTIIWFNPGYLYSIHV